MEKLSLVLLICFLNCKAQAQFSQAERDSIGRLTKADYVQFLGQLGLKEGDIRPGPSGNSAASNAANSEESKVRDYILPELMKLENGITITTPQEGWQQRRPEIEKAFEQEIYGKFPENIPSVTWRLIDAYDTVIGNFPIYEKILKGVVDNAAFPSIKVEIELLVATPLNSEGPVPMVIEFGFIKSPFNHGPVHPIGQGSANEPTWKEQLISSSWGYSILVPSSVQADNGAGLRQGIIGLLNNGEPRKSDDWGSLKAWAWGASKVIDYLETDNDVDSKRLAIEGLSRYGKAAIVAMAFEPRISLGFIGSLGAGGLKILRRNFGEQV